MRGRSWRVSATVIATGALLAAGLPAYAVEGDEAIPQPVAPPASEEQLPPESAFNDEWVAPEEPVVLPPETDGVPEPAWTPQTVPADGALVPGPGAVSSPAPKTQSQSNAAPQAASTPAPSPSPTTPPAAPTVAAPGLGALPWFSFDERTMSANTVARVNLGNGNLLLTSNDAVLNSPSIPVRNDRFYNGLTSVTGSFGGGWSSALSATDSGLRITSTDATFVGPNGFRARFVKNGTAWTTPAGFNAGLVGPTNGFYRLTYNESGEWLEFNTSGWLTRHKDRNDVGVHYSYTGSEVTGVLETSGRAFTIAWTGATSARRIASITDEMGRATTYTRDGAGRLTRMVSPGGFWEEYSYDSSGRLSQFRTEGAEGGNSVAPKIDFSYDAQNRVTAIRQGTISGSSYLRQTTYAYTSGQTVITDARGNKTTYAIDTQGRATSATDALGRKRSQTYTPNSDIATTLDALGSGSTPGNTTTYAYDQLNNAIGVTYPTGAAASATYALGSGCNSTGGTQFQLKCTVSDAGNRTEYDYDAKGNVTSVTDTTAGGTGAVTQQYTYAVGGGQGCFGSPDGFGGQVCSSTDGRGNVTKYDYDRSGQLILVDPPAPMGDTTYTYDPAGRIASVRDGNGATTRYTYNVRDQIITTTYAGGEVMTTNYWLNSLKGGDRFGPDDLRIYRYDPLGQMSSERIRSTLSNGVVSLWAPAYTYDAVGNLLTYNSDRYGTTRYGYDAANQLITIGEPYGGACPADGSTPTDSGCIRIAYDANGSETSRTFPGGATVVRTIDNAGRPTRITAKDGAGVVRSDIGYSFQAAGTTGATGDRLAIQTRTSFLEQGIPAGAVTSYAYDTLQRLTSATEKTTSGATNATFAYTYDAAGNRTSRNYSGAIGNSPLAPAAGQVNYTYNAANQLTATSTDTAGPWAYDSTGALVKNGQTGTTASYNDRGSVTAVGGPAPATYQTFGQGNADTFARTANGVTTSTPTSAIGAMGEDFGNQRITTRTPDGEALSSRLGAGTRYYYATDHLGSVTGMFAKDGTYYGGYTYSPYGEARYTGTNTALTINKLRYIAGYWDDNADAYRLGARYYDTDTGRFTQYDPSGQEANPYSYAGCNPVNGSDPTGLAPNSCSVAGLAATTINGALWTAAGLAFAPPAAAAAAVFGTTLTLGLGIATLWC